MQDFMSASFGVGHIGTVKREVDIYRSGKAKTKSVLPTRGMVSSTNSPLLCFLRAVPTGSRGRPAKEQLLPAGQRDVLADSLI